MKQRCIVPCRLGASRARRSMSGIDIPIGRTHGTGDTALSYTRKCVDDPTCIRLDRGNADRARHSDRRKYRADRER
jgi:hypothetical protein